MIGLSAKSQVPVGFPTVNAPNGYYNIGWLQASLGIINAQSDTTIRPRFMGTEIVWLHAGVDTAKWIWFGKWIKESSVGLNALNATAPIVYNPGTGNISCPTCGSGSGGLTSLNGLTTGTQTFSTGTAGSDFNISSVGSVHTFNFPDASASNRGLLNTTDWATFNTKQPQLNGTGFVKATGTTITYDNSSYYLASNPGAFIPRTSLSALAPILYNSATGVFSSDTSTGLNHLATQAYVLAHQSSGTINGAGNLVPLFTTSIVSNTLVFTLSTATANTVFGNSTGSTAAPTYYVPNSTILNTWFGGAGIQPQLSGTGFVKATGTSISYDNSTYLTAVNLNAVQNATTYSITNSGGTGATLNTYDFTHAGLMDTLRGHYLDSLQKGLKNFNIFAVQGLKIYGNSNDSLGLGGSFYQADTLATNGFAFLITGLPHKTYVSTDSSLIQDNTGKTFKVALMSLTTTGTSGAATFNASTGVLNIPQYTGSGGGGGIGVDSVVTITSGTSSTVTNGFNVIRFNPTSVMSTYTLTLPATWHTSNNLLIAFTANGTITAGNPMVTTLTIVNGSGQTISQAVTPTTAAAGEVIVYHLIGTVDQRVN